MRHRRAAGGRETAGSRSARIRAAVAPLRAVADEDAEEPVAPREDRVDELANALGGDQVADEEDDDAIIDEIERGASHVARQRERGEGAVIGAERGGGWRSRR